MPIVPLLSRSFNQGRVFNFFSANQRGKRYKALVVFVNASY